jgi:glycosyltransferase involved in cell wall biosynthesis
MKIGMVTTIGPRCGIAAYTRALVAGLESLPDTEVEVVPITEGRQSQEFYQAQADRLNAPDIDVVHIQHEHSFWGSITPASSDYLALIRLALKIDKVSPSSTYWNFRYLLKKPIVLTAHTTYSVAEMLKVATETNPLKKWIKERMLANEEYRDSVESAPFATGVTLVHTEAARQALIERGAKPNYVVVVPTGLPAPVPAPTAGAAFRERFGLADRRLITIFGYLVFNKGYELTLEVLPSLPDNVTLVIAGGARNADMEPYAEGLRAQIAASGLENRVVITGYLEETEVAEAMAASEIVLAPHTVATGSYSVTVPLTYGKPTLSSDLDCFQEIARRGDAVAMFRAGDTADYREKLLALLNSPEEQTHLATAAQRYADRFAWPKVAGLTRTIYKNAIDVYSRGHHPHMVSL